MARLAEGVEETVDRWQPAAAVLESLFHGRNSRSLIALAQARGVILSVLGRHGLDVREFSPAEVKQAVCGSGRADKTQVSRMVDVLLGPAPARRSADASDALAVALCYSPPAAPGAGRGGGRQRRRNAVDRAVPKPNPCAILLHRSKVSQAPLPV